MNKMSQNMLKQIMGGLYHMTEIDAESKAMILAEIDRIEKKNAPKKKEEAAEVVENPENSSAS